MPWTNYHSHSNYCDGHNNPREYLMKAIDLNMVSYGFSSHAPLPFDCEWSMNPHKSEKYTNEIRELTREFSGKLQIYLGLEVDYIPGVIGPQHDTIKKLGLDYTIGSIHFIDSFPNGKPWNIDNTGDLFYDGLIQLFNNRIKDAVTRYYKLTRRMIRESNPNVIGHLDKIKMHNQRFNFFDENEEWYQEQVIRTLEIIKAYDTIVEINTRGYYKSNDALSPSPWIIEIMNDMDIKIMLSSDAHRPDEITKGFEFATGIISKCGYQKIYSLINDKWKAFEFDNNGIKV